MENKSQNGFTLVEVLIAMVVSGIIVSAIYSAFSLQKATAVSQEQVTEMQQNIRAGLGMIKRDLRMAGYDYDNTDNIVAGVGFTTAGSTLVAFTFVADTDGNDNNNDGTVDEAGELKSIQFDMYDAYADGVNDLGREVGGANKRALIENIQNVEFVYLDSAGNVTATLADIRTVQVSILARVDKGDPKFTNNITYTTGSGTVWGPYGDNRRRRLLVTTIDCRNMGI